MKILHVFIICALISTKLCLGYKILAIFPLPISSHYILGSALLTGLAEAGHDVTMISPFEQKNPPKNGSWRDIVLTGGDHEDITKRFASFEAGIEEKSKFWFVLNLASFNKVSTEKVLNHTNIQKLMKSGEKFDAVIAGNFMNDAVRAFAPLFDAHLIVFSSVGANSLTNKLTGVPALPSLTPEVISNFPAKMSFIQRLINTGIYLVFTGLQNFYNSPAQSELVKKYFPSTINLNSVNNNVSLVLLNSHISLANPQPIVPCMIDIGGFHIKPPRKLPEDLQSYLDNAEEGVVYMSMGSILKSKSLPLEKREALLRAFGKLKQKVLWKWEDDDLPGKPPNVKLGKWLPQQDILAHPNVKLFITHSGLLSTTETVYHGVPIIGIPIFGDQMMNAYAAEREGYGVVLPFTDLSEEILSALLNEVLNNPRYLNEAQRRSRIMKDSQVNSLDNAIYWVEYVIRHKGANHLRVAYLDLTWYQYYLLDVFAFTLAVIVGVYILLKRTLKYVISKAKQSKRKVE